MNGATARKWTSVIAWLLAASGALLFMGDCAALAREPAAIAFQAFAAVVLVWARVTFGLRSFHAAANPTAGELVTRGPYRFVRNPIYASLIVFFAAALIDHRSVRHLAFFGLLAGGLVLRSLLEEAELRAHYPGYAEYAARTSRLLPFIL